MTHEQIAIIALLITQALSIYTLRLMKREHDHWRSMWTRDADKWLLDSAELFYWKRYATLRDPKTGRYVKKDKR